MRVCPAFNKPVQHLAIIGDGLHAWTLSYVLSKHLPTNFIKDEVVVFGEKPLGKEFCLKHKKIEGPGMVLPCGDLSVESLKECANELCRKFPSEILQQTKAFIHFSLLRKKPEITNILENYICETHKAFVPFFEQRGLVSQIKVIESGRKHIFQVIHADSKSWKASYFEKVVIAGNANNVINVPDFAFYREPRHNFPANVLVHASKVDLSKYRDEELSGKFVTIVGGGLVSAGLAIGAIKRGAQVTILSNIKLTANDNLYPGWSEDFYRKEFLQSSLNERFRKLQSVISLMGLPTKVLNTLRHYKQKGRLQLYEEVKVKKVSWNEKDHKLELSYQSTNSDTIASDFVWLATGSSYSINNVPLLRDIIRHYSINCIGNYPILQSYNGLPSLKWPRLNLYLMGGLTSLYTGIESVGTIGAERAADFIVHNIISEAGTLV